MTTVQRLEEILSSPRLQLNSKNFVNSLLLQAKTRELSPKQLEYVDKFWTECFPSQEILEEENKWEESFTEEMRENTNIVGQYFECHYPSSFLAKNYKKPGWIPPKHAYDKFINSEYAKSLIKNYHKEYVYKVGDIVDFRDTALNRRAYPKEWMDSPLIVLDQIKSVKNNFINQYKVSVSLLMENMTTTTLKEDQLYIPKRRKKGA